MAEASPTVTAHRSYSQLNALRNCGEMFRLERVAKVPQRPSVPAVAGKVIHAATETIDHLIHDGQRDPLALEIAASETADRELTVEVALESQGEHADPATWKRYGRATAEKPNGEDLEWFRRTGIPLSITAYIDWRLRSGLDLLVLPGFGPAIEVPFETYIGNQLVHGYIDRVFQQRDCPYLLDIKSGQKPKTDEQLGVYRYALHLGANLDVTYGGYLYGLKTGVAKLTPPINLQHWTPSKLEQVYVQGSKLIEQGIYLPSPGEQCFRCSVSDHCDFAISAI